MGRGRERARKGDNAKESENALERVEERERERESVRVDACGEDEGAGMREIK